MGSLLSGFGDLQTSGVPICELLIKLATFWLGATRGLLEAFLSGIGTNGFPICELLIKLATFWPEATRGPFGGLFSGIGALQTSGFPITYVSCWLTGWGGWLAVWLGNGPVLVLFWSWNGPGMVL